MLATRKGIAIENRIPVKIPVIKDAAANMPAVEAYCESTILNTKYLLKYMYLLYKVLPFFNFSSYFPLIILTWDNTSSIMTIDSRY